MKNEDINVKKEQPTEEELNAKRELIFKLIDQTDDIEILKLAYSVFKVFK